MKIIQDKISNNAPGNGIVIKESDVLLLRPIVDNAAKNGLRIHGMAKNVWTVGGKFSNTKGNDNVTVHFGDTGSYEIRDIFFFGCESYNAKEEAYDAVIGENIWYFFCKGDRAVAGHKVKKVFYVGCEFDQLKVKASEEIYLIHSTVKNLIFETQGNAGQGVGAGEGPKSVYVYQSKIAGFKPNQYGHARIDIEKLPEDFALPVVPSEVWPYVKDYYNNLVNTDTSPTPAPVPDPTHNDDPIQSILADMEKISANLSSVIEKLKTI